MSSPNETTRATPSTRRDTRFVLPRGSAFIEYDDPRGSAERVRTALGSVGVAGLGFEIDDTGGDFPFGSCLENVTLTIGRCMLSGDAVVRNTRQQGEGRTDVGCLFYPSPRDEDRWMTLIAGIEVASAPPEEAPR